MFEHYVTTYPTASREVCDSVDLIFMNQVEYDRLYGDAQLPVPKAPLVVKRGPAGARLLVDGHPQEVEAPAPRVVDPTGGGEVLAGVFLALRADGLPERTALKYAVRASARCAEDHGVTGSHLTAELDAIRREVLRRRLTRGRAAGRTGTGIPHRLIALHSQGGDLRRHSRGRAARRSPCEQFG